MGVTEKDIQDVLRAVKDPELNLDLVVLGLIYDIEITDCDVHIVMSLTSPMCPVAEQLVSEVEASVLAVEGGVTRYTEV